MSRASPELAIEQQAQAAARAGLPCSMRHEHRQYWLPLGWAARMHRPGA